MKFFIQFLFLGISLVATAIFWTNMERKRHLRLSSRAEIDFAQWFHRYSSEVEFLPLAQTEIILSLVAESIGVKPTQLRPTDRFDSELALSEAGAMDDSIDCLEELLQDRFGEQMTVSSEWQTLGDLLRGVVPLIHQQRCDDEITQNK